MVGNGDDADNKIKPTSITITANDEPTAVELHHFDVNSTKEDVLLTWETLSESNNAGFYLYRADSPQGEKTLIAWIPSALPGGSEGALYEYRDTDVTFGVPYVYWLADLDLNSRVKSIYGPERVFWWKTYLPLSFFGW